MPTRTIPFTTPLDQLGLPPELVAHLYKIGEKTRVDQLFSNAFETEHVELCQSMVWGLDEREMATLVAALEVQGIDVHLPARHSHR